MPLHRTTCIFHIMTAFSKCMIPCLWGAKTDPLFLLWRQVLLDSQITFHIDSELLSEPKQFLPFKQKYQKFFSVSTISLLSHILKSCFFLNFILQSSPQYSKTRGMCEAQLAIRTTRSLPALVDF